MTDDDARLRRVLEAYRVPAVAPDLTDRVLARLLPRRHRHAGCAGSRSPRQPGSQSR
jgi:hypothetical protein